MGVEKIISFSAVGSLHIDYAPRHMAVPTQLIDRTRHRPDTFFGDGIVGHVAFGDPVSPVLADVLAASAKEAGATTHVGGTYVCMEGPAFSTRAESELYRSWGASVVGMTNIPEAKLAREAEIAYATVALATDYDCWHPEHDNVDVAAVIATIQKNVAVARRIVEIAAANIPAALDPLVEGAAQFAVMTSPDKLPADRLEALRPIIGKYL
jgi:5'-methylthioadenosine phosphorylase